MPPPKQNPTAPTLPPELQRFHLPDWYDVTEIPDTRGWSFRDEAERLEHEHFWRAARAWRRWFEARRFRQDK